MGVNERNVVNLAGRQYGGSPIEIYVFRICYIFSVCGMHELACAIPTKKKAIWFTYSSKINTSTECVFATARIAILSNSPETNIWEAQLHICACISKNILCVCVVHDLILDKI
jgi:hypothetical protein